MPRVCLSKPPNIDVGCGAVAGTPACAAPAFQKPQLLTSNPHGRGEASACAPPAIPPSVIAAWTSASTARRSRCASLIMCLSPSGHMTSPACRTQKQHSYCTHRNHSTALAWPAAPGDSESNQMHNHCIAHYSMEAARSNNTRGNTAVRYKNLGTGNTPMQPGRLGMNEPRDAFPLPSQACAHQRTPRYVPPRSHPSGPRLLLLLRL